jgi:hypothetical protein
MTNERGKRERKKQSVTDFSIRETRRFRHGGQGSRRGYQQPRPLPNPLSLSLSLGRAKKLDRQSRPNEGSVRR